jgi:kynureninase
VTPPSPQERGAQLSVQFGSRSESLYNYLLSTGHIVDIRKPDVIRIAPAPLYTSFMDVVHLCNAIEQYALQL